MNRLNHGRRFTAYPKYVDSEIEWIGKVPSHWATSRLKATTSGCYNGVWGNPPSGDSTDSVCIRVADFNRISFDVDVSDLTVRSIPDKELGVRELQSGDLLLEKSGGGEKQPVGAVVTFYGLEQPAVCSNFIARMPITTPNSARFITYVHAAFYSMRVNVRSIKQSTGIQNLDSDSYLSEKICLPPPGEQVTIAHFLDREAAKIDTLIAKKERLIALLEDKRTALITHAVTKGLDPTVPVKDSGIDWLGEMPAHWDVSQLKRYWRVIDCKHLTVPFMDEGISLASVREVQSFNLDLTTANRTSDDWYRHLVSGGRQPTHGDLIYCRNVNVGACAYVSTNDLFAMGQDVCLIRSDKQNQRYLNYLLHSWFMQQQLGQVLIGSTFNRINVAEIKSLAVLVPPLDEQRTIAAFLDQETAKIHTLIVKVQEASMRLQEYRSSLISAAVTGKIDVRGEVA